MSWLLHALWLLGGTLTPVPPPALQVTQGAVAREAHGALAVEVPRLRAVVPRAPGDEVELRFTYLGPTRVLAPLASGELREQLGLKLRAQDGCNVLYAMWRLAPRAELVVQVKHNPGHGAYRDCGTRGYRTVRPLVRAPLPVLRPGASHRLRAQLSGEHLRVLVDGAVVWEGEVGTPVARLRGAVGLRSDNVRFRFTLLTQPLRPAGEDVAAPAED